MRRYLMLGLGRQSSALAMMAENGLIEPFDAMFFGDTLIEESDVYVWKDILQRHLRQQITTVSRGDLAQDILDGLRNGTSFRNIPLWTLGIDGREAPIMRQCTPEYKIEVCMQEIRRLHGIGPGEKMTEKVEVVLGFSCDEKSRMTESGLWWVQYAYDLIDMWWDVEKCSQYLVDLGIGRPPKSACWCCPYKNNAAWRRLRDFFPLEWAKACAFDHAIRHHPGFKNPMYLHRSLKPLDQAPIDEDDSQLDMFSCTGGFCGK